MFLYIKDVPSLGPSLCTHASIFLYIDPSGHRVLVRSVSSEREREFLFAVHILTVLGRVSLGTNDSPLTKHPPVPLSSFRSLLQDRPFGRTTGPCLGPVQSTHTLDSLVCPGSESSRCVNQIVR